jgi:ABC-type bacteriocin/lantibiotic exporter with double-glycine peptidase domain
MLACLRMLLAHRGRYIDEAALAEEVSLKEGGLDPDALVELAQSHRVRLAAQQLDTAAIAALVKEEQFPIVIVDRSFVDREFAIHAVIPIRSAASSLLFLIRFEGSDESRWPNSRKPRNVLGAGRW